MNQYITHILKTYLLWGEDYLFGLHTITVNLLAEVYFHGFYFDKSPKAFANLRALDSNLIANDSYKITDETVDRK